MVVVRYITQRVKQMKHLSAVSSGSSNKVTHFSISSVQSTNESKRIVAEEDFFAYYTMIHNHSFRSTDYTTSILQKNHKNNFSKM